ncbi:MAG: hypothetical protein IJX19_09855 [Clostridia bacterium]|nr:hypothetical protein [Clostridia bacterium]
MRKRLELDMKKKIIVIAVIFVVLLIIARLSFFMIARLFEKDKEDRVLKILSSYEKNDQFALIGDSYIYLNDRTIPAASISEYKIEDFLYVTKEHLYFYTLSNQNKTLHVYQADYNLKETKELFVQTYDFRPQAYMVDTRYVYIMTDKYHRYDFETDEYLFLGDDMSSMSKDFYARDLYSFSQKNEGLLSGTESRVITITRKTDGVTKTISSKALLKSAEAKQINDVYPICLLGIEFKNENVYLYCSAQYGVAVLFQYDFDSETISFYGWRDVIDTDGDVNVIVFDNEYTEVAD